MHDFRIDIEADSTIAPDEMAEKMGRVEFLEQMVPMLKQVIPIAQGNPPMAALAKELTMFAVRGFKIARSLEETFEKAFDAIAQMPPNENAMGQKSKGGGTDPHVEMAKVQAQAQADQGATAQKAQAAQQANAIKAQQVQGTLAVQAQNAASEAQFRQGKLAIEQQRLQQRQVMEGLEMEHMMATEGRALE